MKTPLRYYVYVSDAKVDRLFEQIPLPVSKRIAGELKINFQIVAITIAQNPTSDTRIGRLTIIDRHLQEQGVGTVDEPSSYIKGSLEMAYAPLGGAPDSIYFDGEMSSTIIGLGGSRRHMLGEGVSNEPVRSYSASYNLLEALATEDDLGTSGYVDPTNESVKSAPESDRFSRYARAVQMTHCAMQRFPTQTVDFLARTLFVHSSATNGETASQGVLLGTPIWVALADT